MASWYDLSSYVDDDFVSVPEALAIHHAHAPADAHRHDDGGSDWFTVGVTAAVVPDETCNASTATPFDDCDERLDSLDDDEEEEDGNNHEVDEVCTANVGNSCSAEAAAFRTATHKEESAATAADDDDKRMALWASYADAARRAGGGSSTSATLPDAAVLTGSVADEDAVVANAGDAEEQQEDDYQNEDVDEQDHDEDDDDEEEWILEMLLKRRAVSPADGGSCVVFEYLCKWKYVDEPTWEVRETLEEAGYVKRLDAFDYERLPKKKGTAAANADPQQARRAAGAVSSLTHLAGGETGEPPLIQDHAYWFANMAPRRFLINPNSSMANNITPWVIKKFSPIHNYALEKRFMDYARRVINQCRDELLFVRVPPQYVRQVVHEGLRAAICAARNWCCKDAAKRILVTAARCPYAVLREGDTNSALLFACIGMVPRSTDVKHEYDTKCISVDERVIVPLWLLQCEPAAEGSLAFLAPRHAMINKLVAKATQRVNHASVRPGTASSSSLPAHCRIPTTKREVKQGPRAAKEYFQPAAHRR